MAVSKGPAVRSRAAKACKACHQRRVKCDAVEKGLPCTRCEQNGISPCCLIESKRGTYSRSKARQENIARSRQTRSSHFLAPSQSQVQTTTAESNSSSASGSANGSANESNEQSGPGSTWPNDNASPALPLERPDPSSADPGSVPAPSPLVIGAPFNSQAEVPGLPYTPSPDTLPTIHPQLDQGPMSEPQPRQASNRSAQFAARPAEQPSHHFRVPPAPSSNVLTGHDLSTPKSDLTDSTASSYREISWTTMFDHFLDGRRRHRPSLIDKCSITYLGESFPLAMVLEDLEEGGKMKLHHPGLPVPGKESGADIPSQQHPSYMRHDEIATLTAKGAFEYPPPDTIDALLRTFLDRVYPIYPMVCRRELIEQFRDRTIPWLLLHSLCFVASTFCPISVLHQAKFSGRQEARFYYYNKAKMLFDAGYEVNKVVMLQSTMLLAFWAGGPNDFWNFYSWNSTAVTIAEALGIHRSMASTNMNRQDLSLLRRLWWILVIRDASCGALFGRPFRISMDFSDAEILTMADFDGEMASAEFAHNPLKDVFGLYQIHMARLSLILREIVGSRFSRHSDRTQPASLVEQLHTWLDDLPPELNWNNSEGGSNPFAWALSLLYDHHLILCSLGQSHPTKSFPPDQQQQQGQQQDGDTETMQRDRGVCSGRPPASPSEPKTNHSPTIDAAAQRILSLACGIVRRSAALTMPHEAFPGLFLAEVIFYRQTKSGDFFRAQLGQSSLTTCQMAWQSISEAWDSAPWVMRLFDNLASHSQQETRQGSENPEMADVPVSGSNIGTLNAGLNPSSFLPQEMSGVDLGFMPEAWQGHGMLSTFLDTSFDWSGSDPPLTDSYSAPNFLSNLPTI